MPWRATRWGLNQPLHVEVHVMEIETVGDLLDALSEFDAAMPLAVANQPSWPLTAVPVAVTEWAGRVWLATREAQVGGSLYAPGEAWEGSGV